MKARLLHAGVYCPTLDVERSLLSPGTPLYFASVTLLVSVRVEGPLLHQVHLSLGVRSRHSFSTPYREQIWRERPFLSLGAHSPGRDTPSYSCIYTWPVPSECAVFAHIHVCRADAQHGTGVAQTFSSLCLRQIWAGPAAKRDTLLSPFQKQAPVCTPGVSLGTCRLCP